MKRLLAVFLAAAMAFSMAACGGEQTDASSTAVNGGISQPETEAPEYNLLTGQDLAEGVAPGQRPVAIMVNNSQAGMPQRGLGSADAVFEMVTEGGITRMMAMYSDANTIPQVGPVRSARDQHLQFALPLNAIFVHIGSSVYAQNLLNGYKYQDVDGLYLGETAFSFDSERAKSYLQEFCWYTDAGLIAAGIQNQQIATSGAVVPLFQFSKTGVTLTEQDAPDISFSFSSISTSRLVYDANTQTYLKQANGADGTGCAGHFFQLFVHQHISTCVRCEYANVFETGKRCCTDRRVDGLTAGLQQRCHSVCASGLETGWPVRGL